MLRAAADLTRDIARARPEIYWPDMLVSAGLGYGALALAIRTALSGAAVWSWWRSACLPRWRSIARCCSFTN
jgi:hypothetical protein